MIAILWSISTYTIINIPALQSWYIPGMPYSIYLYYSQDIIESQRGFNPVTASKMIRHKFQVALSQKMCVHWVLNGVSWRRLLAELPVGKNRSITHSRVDHRSPPHGLRVDISGQVDSWSVSCYRVGAVHILCVMWWCNLQSYRGKGSINYPTQGKPYNSLPPLERRDLWDVSVVTGLRIRSYVPTYTSIQILGTQGDLFIIRRTRKHVFSKKCSKWDSKSCPADDGKCDGATYWATGVKDRSTTQPRVSFIMRQGQGSEATRPFLMRQDRGTKRPRPFLPIGKKASS